MVRVCISVSLVAFLLIESTAGFDLTILHTNDVNSHFDETDAMGNQCMQNEECFGGFARMKTVINEKRSENKHLLLLDAGNQYTGTPWYYKYNGSLVVDFMNKLGYDAMALGSHEFDDGPQGLMPLITQANFPVLGANINASADKYLHDTINETLIFSFENKVNYTHTSLVEESREKVGIVGYTTSATTMISQPGQDVKFLDEIEVIQKEVDQFEKMDVNKIIVLGNSGYLTDLEIAKKVKGVDIVIGAHSSILLYNGTAPSNEKPVDVYPKVITQADGNKVLVVQSYPNGKYIGYLKVSFNASGKVTHWEGNPILLNNNVIQDNAILKALKPYKEEIKNWTMQVVGQSKVLLDKSSDVCKLRECNIGNFVADALLWKNLMSLNSTNWNYVAITMVNGGAFRQSISRGEVTMQNIIEAFPYRSAMVFLKLKGKFLKEVFNHSSFDYSESRDRGYFGGFLQVSGVKVTYAMHKPKGVRVSKLLVKCHKCAVPEYVPVDDDEIYPVVTSSFLANGGDGYTVLRDNKSSKTEFDIQIVDILADYFRNRSPMITALEQRIVILDKNTPWCLCWSNEWCPCGASGLYNTSILILIIYAVAVKYLII